MTWRTLEWQSEVSDEPLPLEAAGLESRLSVETAVRLPSSGRRRTHLFDRQGQQAAVTVLVAHAVADERIEHLGSDREEGLLECVDSVLPWAS